MVEKQKSLLSTSQREYLMSDRSDRDFRRRIRNRVEPGLRDFQLLFENMERRDIELLFREPEPAAPDDVAQANGEVDDLEAGVRNDTIQEYQHRADIYRSVVSAIGFFYEVHQHKNWDFADTLRLAIEYAHQGADGAGNPRGLPERRVNEERFKFDPALESVETHEEKVERIEQKIEAEEALTPEEELFVIKNRPWRSLAEQREFLDEQRRLRVRQHNIEQYADKRPWMDADEG